MLEIASRDNFSNWRAQYYLGSVLAFCQAHSFDGVIGAAALPLPSSLLFNVAVCIATVVPPGRADPFRRGEEQSELQTTK